MSEVLSFEADQTVLTITKNSLSSDKSTLQKDEKTALYPNFGNLTPVYDDLAEAKNEPRMKEILDPWIEFSSMFGTSSQDVPLTEQFKLRSVTLNLKSFEQQFHFGTAYSFLKLKELEIRNMILIANCINLDQKDKIANKLVKIL